VWPNFFASSRIFWLIWQKTLATMVDKDVSLILELDLCHSWGLSETYLASLAFNAAKSSFLDDQAKKELLKV
jgi:adenosine deaminase